MNDASDSFRREEELFHRAKALPDAARASFLENASGGNVALVDAVLALLTADGQTLTDVDRPLLPSMEDGRAESKMSEAGSIIAGRYRLLEKLGEGGWGTVYRAEQSEPVRRSVAIKILKAGLDTRAVVARFRAEQQALAMMEHAGIARVFDAGETEQGRPYFVMELVGGERITDYCDNHRLTVRERLELFVRVCEAVQHAHQKGVIHRDLKPSNILVVEDAGAAAPKIIDFGIAKALQGRLGEETVVTEVDGFMGTPAYMSPEQADGRNDQVDTRTDVYSLGVLLYELLAGDTPLGPVELRRLGVAEVRRRIGEVEPLGLRARVRARDGAALAQAAESRNTTATRLIAELDGDLDSVAMKCLEKSSARRYESVSVLAQDIAHYLANEPVTARPAGRMYVLGKLVRRHRVGFAVAAVIAVLLVAGVAVSTLLLFREKAALERALAAEHDQAVAREAAEKSSRQARTEATRSARVTQFMTSMLDGVGPGVARGRDTGLLREILNEAAGRLEKGLEDEPTVEADLREVMGDVLWLLDEQQESQRMHRRALALREQAFGPSHPKVADSLMRIGQFQRFHRQSREAEGTYRRAVEIRTRVLGTDHLATAEALHAFSQPIQQQSRWDETLELLQRALAIQRPQLRSDDLRLLSTEFSLAALRANMGDRSAAMQEYRAIAGRYPSDTSGQLLRLFKQDVLVLIANQLHGAGERAEALATYREAVAAGKAQGRRTLDTELRFAQALGLEGEFAEPLAFLPEVVEMARKGAARERTRRAEELLAGGLDLWGHCLAKVGRHAEAETVLREACSLPDALSRFRTAPEHPALLLETVLTALGRRREVEPMLRAALQKAEREKSHFVYGLVAALHRVLKNAARFDEAKQLMRTWLARERERIGQDGEVAAAGLSVATLCAANESGESAAVEGVARERLTWWKTHRPNAEQVHAYQAVLGEALLAQKRFTEAEVRLLPAGEAYHRGIAELLPEGADWPAYRLPVLLVRLYRETDRPEDPGVWRQWLPPGSLDPRWELQLARAMTAGGRYLEAGEVVTAALKRARREAEQKSEETRAGKTLAELERLADECQSRLGGNMDAVAPLKENK